MQRQRLTHLQSIYSCSCLQAEIAQGGVSRSNLCISRALRWRISGFCGQENLPELNLSIPCCAGPGARTWHIRTKKAALSPMGLALRLWLPYFACGTGGILKVANPHHHHVDLRNCSHLLSFSQLLRNLRYMATEGLW